MQNGLCFTVDQFDRPSDTAVTPVALKRSGQMRLVYGREVEGLNGGSLAFRDGHAGAFDHRIWRQRESVLQGAALALLHVTSTNQVHCGGQALGLSLGPGSRHLPAQSLVQLPFRQLA